MFPRHIWTVGLAAASLAALACWLPYAITIRVPVVRVAWESGTAPSGRAYLERKRGLRTLGESDVTVDYLLTDASPAAVAALVASPGLTVVDGVQPRTGAPGLWRDLSLVDWADRAHGLELRPYLKPTTSLFAAWLGIVVALVSTRAGRAWLATRVPEVDVRTLGICRAVTGVGLAVVVLLAGWPALWWRLAGLALAAAFIAGMWPRAVLAALCLLLVLALGWDAADHDYFAPLQAWVLFLTVPWGAGVLPWRVPRTGTPDQAASRRHGLAVVVVPLVLGSAYLAAALAKLDQSTHAWLLGGAIRYHIAQDGPAAPGSLWRFVANQDWLTVPLSPLVIACEALVMAAAISTRPSMRFAVFGLAASLHLGFGLLQGVWWEAWWVLLPLLLPWPAMVERLWPRVAPAPAPRVSAAWPSWAPVLLAAFLLQQPLVSLLRLEWKPWVSNFPMYSNVAWQSPEEYAAYMDRAKAPGGRALRLVSVDGAPVAGLPAVLTSLAGCRDFVVLTAPVVARESAMPDERTAIDACAAAYAGAQPSGPSLVVEASPLRFSWDVVDFVHAGKWTAVGRLGP